MNAGAIMKNTVYIKNSSKDVNFGLHNLKIKIRTDGGRVLTSKKYDAVFEVDYGEKGNYKTDLTLKITERKNV